MTLTAVGSAPVAVLRGPTGDVGDDADLLLDATASSDPDSLPSLQSLTYVWECRRADFPTPCFTSAEQGDQVRLALPPRYTVAPLPCSPGCGNVMPYSV